MSSQRVRPFLAAIIGAGLLLIAFQNCGQGMQSADPGVISSSSSLTPNPSPTPTPAPAPTPLPPVAPMLKNQWLSVTTSGAPSVRYMHAAVSAGNDRAIVWGGQGLGNGTTTNGFLNSGAIYNALTNTWSAMSMTGAPSARGAVASVWTGTKMIVWGGMNFAANNYALGDGAIYDPATNTWQGMSNVNAPSPRVSPLTAWTGNRMIVYDGVIRSATASATANHSGALYDPVDNSWQTMNMIGAPPFRSEGAFLWIGNRLVVWGGRSNLQGSIQERNNGAMYDPATDSWTAISSVGAPSRGGQLAVTDGSKMCVYEGNTTNSGAIQAGTNVGAIFDPATNTWAPMNLNGAPTNPPAFSAWIGNRMFVWGGMFRNAAATNTYFNTGGIYNPATDTWTAASVANAPVGRADYDINKHTMISLGSRAFVFGGNGNNGFLNSGGIFE